MQSKLIYEDKTFLNSSLTSVLELCNSLLGLKKTNMRVNEYDLVSGEMWESFFIFYTNNSEIVHQQIPSSRFTKKDQMNRVEISDEKANCYRNENGIRALFTTQEQFKISTNCNLDIFEPTERFKDLSQPDNLLDLLWKCNSQIVWSKSTKRFTIKFHIQREDLDFHINKFSRNPNDKIDQIQSVNDLKERLKVITKIWSRIINSVSKFYHMHTKAVDESVLFFEFVNLNTNFIQFVVYLSWTIFSMIILKLLI